MLRPHFDFAAAGTIMDDYAKINQTLHRRRKTLLEAGAEQDSRVYEICRRIRRNPGLSWKVESLARSVGLSKGHLHRLFHSILGKSLKSHIVESRLRQALVLLKQTPHGRQLSIKEVAAACGYSSQQFFSLTFATRRQNRLF